MIKKRIKSIFNDKGDGSVDKYFKYNLWIIIVMYVVSIAFLKILPQKIPILHDGPRQIYIQSYIGVFLIPTISLVVNILFRIQKRLFFSNTVLFFMALIGMTIYYCFLL